MRLIGGILTLVLIVLSLAACTGNPIEINIAYSPEKAAWIEERITAFNNQKVAVNGQPIRVEGVERSSGDARTEIKNGALNVTVWSPAASLWLEVLKQEMSNPDVAVSQEPLGNYSRPVLAVLQ
jgi:Ca-activated chloride channel family protein